MAADAGALDVMFNNAGISIGGETEELTLDHWNSIIDVNIRGVVHGVHAAYPVMVRQGSGHIVNTASMGGLMAAGLLTSYVMTKHAVVGLSLALRSEAAAHGVGVTAVCPSAVDTPILDKGAVGRFHGRDYFLKGQGVRRPLDPDAARRCRCSTRSPRTGRCWSPPAPPGSPGGSAASRRRSSRRRRSGSSRSSASSRPSGPPRPSRLQAPSSTTGG